MQIRTYGRVYFRKDLAAVDRERDIGDSSLSGKELQAVNESVRDVANDCARAQSPPQRMQRNPVAALGWWGSKLYGKRDGL